MEAIVKIKHIFLGWFRFLFFKRSPMAKERIKVCFACSERRGIFCGECGCELHAKAEIEEEECPLNKWP